MVRKYRSKPGPATVAEEERRITVTLSISNSNKDYPLLQRFRDAFEAKECRIPSQEELKNLALDLGYAAINAYCETVEQDSESMVL